MKFGPVLTQDALGCVLAHSVNLQTGRLRKGHVLSTYDLDTLQLSGHAHVIVAQYEPGDLAEDDAAARLAGAITGAGLRCSQAATGRVNVFASGPGVAQIDREAIDAFNNINPMITVATVPPYFRVQTDTMVATIKIISYAVPQDDVEKACDVASKALSVLAPQFTSATLIETTIDADAPGCKGRQALVGRLDRLGLQLTPRVIVPHRQDALAAAIGDASGNVVFVLTGSATSDMNDVGPAAVRQAGGVVTQFGMPVDPGNLLFLGDINQKPVIGLPGCARSPALNGADWVLERVLCGVTLEPRDFAQMGVGGLLKEIPTRPKPRGDI